MNINEILSIFYPILYTFLVGFLAYVGKEVVKLVPTLIDSIVAKIGLANYTKTKLIATDIFNKIEEDKRLGDFVGDKLTKFITMMRIKIPGITDGDIDLLNKAISGEYNKDKPIVIKAIEEPIPEPTIITVSPIIKYVNSDGVELQPIQ